MLDEEDRMHDIKDAEVEQRNNMDKMLLQLKKFK